jgi:hypothetical protein
LNFGPVEVTTDSVQVGGIVGELPLRIDYEQIYYTQDVISNGATSNGILIGTKQTDLTIFTSAYFREILLWDNTVWDLANIDIANGVYPTLVVDEEE